MHQIISIIKGHILYRYTCIYGILIFERKHTPLLGGVGIDMSIMKFQRCVKFNAPQIFLEQTRIKYNNASNRGYRVECLDCNYIYETTEQRFSTCPICGKRSSYSERYIYSIFKQTKINFIPQYEFEWLHNRFYDTYLPDYNPIV